jgi:CHAD domain-containing protein
VQANEDGMLAGRDGEYLHQLRVGVRRLRSAMGLLGRVVDPAALDALRAELKWLGGRLGPARDWDVFLGESWPLIAAGLAEVAAGETLEKLSAAARTLSERAGRSARHAWQSRRVGRLLLAFGRAAAGGIVAQGTGAPEPAMPFAAALLERRLERTLRRGKKVRGAAGVARLHALRIAVKKLRYAVEFFGSLYPGTAVERFRAPLVDLQDCLGRVCDAAVMVERVREAVPDEQRLIDCVSGWSACVIHAERARLQRLWRRFRRSPRFW